MIKYAGIALCLDTPELSTFVDSKIPLRRHLVESSRFYPSGSPWAWLETFDIPFPEIGTLYWPNTASRWAVGRFLAHRSMVDSIVETVYQVDNVNSDLGQPISATLQLGFDGEASPTDPITINAPIANPNLVKAKMFMLPPLPLAFTKGPDDLFLLTLVDERYYWRWLELPDFMKQLTQCGKARQTIPWDTVIEDLKTVLEAFRGTDFQVPQQLEDDYLEADPWTIFRDPQESKPRTFPEIMDMVAWNLGRTVTVDYDSQVFMYSFDESDLFHQDDLKAFGGLKTRAAGWDISDSVFPSAISSIIPEKISFSFSEYHAIYGLRTVCTDDEGKEEIVKTLKEALGEDNGPERNKGLSGTVMQVNSSAWRLKGDGDLDDAGGDGGFDLEDENFTKLDELSDRLTKDIFDRLSRSFDISMNSIQNFGQNGLIGITEFHYSGSRQECYTRVRSFPWNAYPEVFNHQDPDIPDPMYKMNFAISDEAWLDEDEPVLMTLLDDEEDEEEGTEKRKILVHTKMGLPENGFPQDTIFHVIWYQEEQCDCKWVAVGAECPDTETIPGASDPLPPDDSEDGCPEDTVPTPTGGVERPFICCPPGSIAIPDPDVPIGTVETFICIDPSVTSSIVAAIPGGCRNPNTGEVTDALLFGTGAPCPPGHTKFVIPLDQGPNLPPGEQEICCQDGSGPD